MSYKTMLIGVGVTMLSGVRKCNRRVSENKWRGVSQVINEHTFSHLRFSLLFDGRSDGDCDSGVYSTAGEE